MISVRCKRCGKEVELKEKENIKEYKEVLIAEKCLDCYGEDYDPEQELLGKIFGEE